MGNAKNASVWAFADVYIAPLDASVPRGGEPFGPEWEQVGLLDGEEGFTEAIEVESEDLYAWGGVLVASTQNNFKLTRKFLPFEDNKVVYDLMYPGHDVSFDGDGGYAGAINVPDLQAKFKIAFETRTGNTIKRTISANYAMVAERGEATENAAELAKREITVAIYPTDADADGKATLFHTYKGEATSATE
ncbi:hypothetical protein HNR23_003786 [Nocardiopsis mwathae]|uniref:Phage tail protein n=1 Tax=Nocardiopsis mwathae TaxID=1472723 RepID=A0A7W9YM48_9ACTN|nr:hypothetical protein [Nocardiopsis mwathae]MBB6173726.1 hypothetical protein [Nocardiopsis mwathae]